MSVSNKFKSITKKIKQQNIKLSICDGELTVKEIHMMPVHIFNALPVWKLRKQKKVIAKELKYSFDGQLFKTIMKQVEITVKNANEIKDKDINFQYGLFINNKFEYIDLGNYFIKDIEDSKKKDEITVTGYDRMIRFMKTFKQSELQLTYPCKMLKLVQKMCEVCGVELYSTDFYNADLDVEKDFFTAQELTYRDVLEKVAQATLTTAFIEDNKLNLYKVSNDAIEKIDKSYLTDLTIKEKFGPANVLVLGRGDVEDNIEETDEKSIEQNGRCEIRFDENEFIEFQRKKVIKGMFEQIKGLEYYSFEASDVGVMWLKPCACIELGDKEDSLYKSYYLKANITINTGISSDIEAEIPEATNTEYKVTTKEEKKTLKVERLAKKNEGLIQDLVEEVGDRTEKSTSITQDINGITQSVSKVKKEIKTVDGKADKAQSTANTAKSTADSTNKNLTTNYYTKTQTENKITQTAESTISEVSKTYSTKTETSTAKSEAINSANTATDNKLKGYTETSKLGTAIEQNYEHVKVAWNQISDFIQMMIINKNASLAILDKNKNVMMALDKEGQHFYKDDGTEFGEMGVNTIDNQNYISFGVTGNYGQEISDGMAWGITTKKDNKFWPILYIKNFVMSDENSDGSHGELILDGCNLVLNGLGTGIETGGVFIYGDPGGDIMYFVGKEDNQNFMTIYSDYKYVDSDLQIQHEKRLEFLDNIIFYKNSAGSNSFKIGNDENNYCLFTDDGSIYGSQLAISDDSNGVYIDPNGKVSGNALYFYELPTYQGDKLVYGKFGHKYFLEWTGSQLQFWVDVTNVGTLSDKRLKTEIQDIDDDFIKAIEEIEMRQFKVANRNGLISFGILAQDLIEIFKKYGKKPFDYEIVYKTQYRTDDDTVYYAINYEQFLILKQKATDKKLEQLQVKDKQKDKLIQDLIQRIETLEKEVNK